MRIRMLTSIAGGRYSYSAGEVADWPDPAEAQRLINAGLAEKFDGTYPENAIRTHELENAKKIGNNKPKPPKAPKPPVAEEDDDGGEMLNEPTNTAPASVTPPVVAPVVPAPKLTPPEPKPAKTPKASKPPKK